MSEGKNDYIAFYKSKQIEVKANTSFEAQQKAAEIFKAKKRYDVVVVLAQKDGQQVTHSPLMESNVQEIWDLSLTVADKKEIARDAKIKLPNFEFMNWNELPQDIQKKAKASLLHRTMYPGSRIKEDREKAWFKNKSQWQVALNKLPVADDDTNWAKDENGKMLAVWFPDRNEGWAKLAEGHDPAEIQRRAPWNPCKKCKGSGKVWSMWTRTDQFCPTCNGRGKVQKNVVKQSVDELGSEKEKKEFQSHINRMPPKKMATMKGMMDDVDGKKNMEDVWYCSKCKKNVEVEGGLDRQGLYNKCMRCGNRNVFPKSKGDKRIKEQNELTDQSWCPKCKINVTPEPIEHPKAGKSACPQCSSKLEPKIDEGVMEMRDCPRCGSTVTFDRYETSKKCKCGRTVTQSGSGTSSRRGARISQGENTVAAVGGFNAPLGSGYKTDKKGVKNNFKVTEMKSLSKLVSEAEKKGADLSKVETSFTTFLEKKSKNGELQQQFRSGYSPDRLMQWIKNGIEQAGSAVSGAYLNQFKSRLKGNPKYDMFVVYSAFLKGAGLGVGQIGEEDL